MLHLSLKDLVFCKKKNKNIPLKNTIPHRFSFDLKGGEACQVGIDRHSMSDDWQSCMYHTNMYIVYMLLPSVANAIKIGQTFKIGLVGFRIN